MKVIISLKGRHSFPSILDPCRNPSIQTVIHINIQVLLSYLRRFLPHLFECSSCHLPHSNILVPDTIFEITSNLVLYLLPSLIK